MGHFPAEGQFAVFVLFAVFGLELPGPTRGRRGFLNAIERSSLCFTICEHKSLLGIFLAFLEGLPSYVGCCSIRINNAARAKIIYLHDRTAAVVSFRQLKQA